MGFKGEKYAKFCMLLPTKHTKLNWGLEKVGKEGDGGSAETRTLDRRIKSPLLYQLSYARGSAETRTLDRRIKSPLLYQLSYAPKPSTNFRMVVGRERLELSTNGLKVRCSTD